MSASRRVSFRLLFSRLSRRDLFLNSAIHDSLAILPTPPVYYEIRVQPLRHRKVAPDGFLDGTGLSCEIERTL